MPAKAAPKRQKAPFGPSLEPLGARHPCLVTLLQPFSRGSHQPMRGRNSEASRDIKAGCRKSEIWGQIPVFSNIRKNWYLTRIICVLLATNTSRVRLRTDGWGKFLRSKPQAAKPPRHSRKLPPTICPLPTKASITLWAVSGFGGEDAVLHVPAELHALRDGQVVGDHYQRGIHFLVQTQH